MYRRILILTLMFSFLIGFTPLQAQDSETLNIIWMRSPSDSQPLLDLILSFGDEFEEENPSVSVNIEFVDWSVGRETIIERFEDGNPPDLAVIGGALGARIRFTGHYRTARPFHHQRFP